MSFIETEQAKESSFILDIQKNINEITVDIQNIEGSAEQYKVYTFLVEKNKIYTEYEISKFKDFNNNFDYTIR